MDARSHRSSADLPAVIAADVGNSKTDVVLVSEAGEVLGAVRGPTASHQQVGPEAAFETLASLAERAVVRAGLDPKRRPLARMIVSIAAGADYPADVRMLTRGLRGTGLAVDQLVTNDCFGGLRAGTTRSWGVCVICGSGMNCLGVAPDGRVARFDALGEMSGDWGGGGDLGGAGLAAAVRAQDRRGPATLLEHTVPAHFGMARPRSLVRAMYHGTIPFRRSLEIAPLVFEAATAGDTVARGIVDRQADEVVAWAGAAIRRLHLRRSDPDVVLAGSVFRAVDTGFYTRIGEGIAAVAPAARVSRLDAPPVLGAALLGLDHLDGAPTPADVELRLRAALTHDRVGGD